MGWLCHLGKSLHYLYMSACKGVRCCVTGFRLRVLLSVKCWGSWVEEVSCHTWLPVSLPSMICDLVLSSLAACDCTVAMSIAYFPSSLVLLPLSLHLSASLCPSVALCCPSRASSSPSPCLGHPAAHFWHCSYACVCVCVFAPMWWLF